MRDGDWRIVYPGTDLTFGTSAPIWNITTPELSDFDITSSDAARPRADGVNFGTDFFGGRTISFDLGVTGADEASVRSSTSALARAWRGDSVRATPGAVAELHSQYRGVERVAFGRPRKFVPDLSGASTQRIATASATFQCADSAFYSAQVYSAGVGLTGTLGGGLVAPLGAPLSTTASSDRSVELEVDSDLPVWPVITISGGDITNPFVEVLGLWRIEVAASLAYDRTLTIDAQPWARTVLLDGGASLAGALTRSSTRLRNASIPSGAYELRFGGASSTNLATATISWRTAHPTP